MFGWVRNRVDKIAVDYDEAPGDAAADRGLDGGGYLIE